MSQLGTFHRPDLGLRALFWYCKNVTGFSFEPASLRIKREGTRRVTVTLQGIGEGAKRNLNPPAKPRPQSDAAGAFACFVDLSSILFRRFQSWPTDSGRLISSRWLELSLGRMLKQKRVTDELEDQGIPVRFRPCRLVCRRGARRAKCFVFHLRTALLLA
jgi:hypothetical protein